jgi:UPF0042 nucleotide-binding protein
MQLVLISGLSGSGKSIALNVLEDSGYYCVDNLPTPLVAETLTLLRSAGINRVALSIDARSGGSLSSLPAQIDGLRREGTDVRLIFLHANNETLIRRFAETRRRHPLATGELTLEEALARERQLLTDIDEIGHRVDTSELHPNTLRNWIGDLLGTEQRALTVLFESFGYKHAIPLDADLIFDARALPNPYYDPQLRPFTGKDPRIVDFLERDPLVVQMLADIRGFVEKWLPHYAQGSRSSLNVAIGCTGGQHRSVYLVEQLAAHFRKSVPVLVRHRQLG